MASKSDEEQTAELKRIFQEWDANEDGYIDRQELVDVMRSVLGTFTEADIDKLLNEADTNKDGKIAIVEFIEWLMKPAGGSLGRAAIDYETQFKDLFSVYDSSKNGVITSEEFAQVHTILQVSLGQFGEDDQAIDPFMVKKEQDAAFKYCDKNKDGKVTYLEFVEWMKTHIPENISPESFISSLVDIADCLKGVFKQMTMLEEGFVEDDSMLQEYCKKLAKSSSMLSEELYSASEEGSASKWTEPPMGLNVDKVKRRHLSEHPLNMRHVKDVHYSVLVIPSPEGSEDPTTRVWMAEVLRTITYKKGETVVRDPPAYYVWKREIFSWRRLVKGDAEEEPGDEKFQSFLSSLPPELGIFCLLKTEANFGTKIDWAGVMRSLVDAIDMAFINHKQSDLFIQSTKDDVEQGFRDDGSMEDLGSNKEEAIDKWLSKKYLLKPREVMAKLSALGIVKISPVWSAFLKSA